MASHSYPTLGFSLLQELESNEIIKKSRTYLVNQEGREHEIIPEISFNLKPEHLESLRGFCSLSKSNLFLEFDLIMVKPNLMDVHENGPEPLCLSLEITEQSAINEKLIEFLFSGSEELKEGEFDLSLLSELMGLETLRTRSQLPKASSSGLYLNQESAKPLLDLMVDGNTSRAELNDIADEFHMLRNSTRWRKLSRLVPHFQRFDREALTDNRKSPEKTRLKLSPKKHNPKIRDDRGEDLYKRNHLHAFESLISLMIGSEEHRQTMILSLKKSRGDLLELLTHLSIGIAGTSIAMLFSVLCSVTSRRVPFCANKVFESALSLSLVLLSWAVNRLREAIADVNKKSIKEEEITKRVERRIKEVHIRAATVIVMVVLRFG